MPPLLNNHGNYHRQPRQCLPLAGRPVPKSWAWKSTRFAAAEVLFRRRRRGGGRCHRRHGRWPRWPAERRIRTGMELHRQVHLHCRRRTWLAGQNPFAPNSTCATVRSAEIRHRHQGAVGNRPGQTQTGPVMHPRRAGRWTARPAAVPVSPKTIRSWSASSSTRTTKTRPEPV